MPAKKNKELRHSRTPVKKRESSEPNASFPHSTKRRESSKPNASFPHPTKRRESSESKNSANTPLAQIADALTRIAEAAEQFTGAPPERALQKGKSWRWRAAHCGGQLIPAETPRGFPLADLRGLNPEIKTVRENTARFLRGKTAHHILLTGARGCGKSSLMRGVLGEFAKKGLRLIETDGDGLARLHYLLPALRKTGEKYVLYCDDLSFAEETPPAAARSALEGSFVSDGGGALLYATANRRHLTKTNFSDDDDIQPGETSEEKLAFADRFGLRLRLFAPDAKEFTALAEHWLRRAKIPPSPRLLKEAAIFADRCGARSGRTARLFAERLAARAGRAFPESE